MRCYTYERTPIPRHATTDGRLAPTVDWHQGPYQLYRHTRMRERAGEPFTPRVPRLVRDHPTWSGVVLAMFGIIGDWLIVSRMARWPDWALLPSMLLATLALLAMVIGLVLVMVRSLEPVISRMDLNWDAEPVGALGLPVALQRKLESLGYWSADDICRAVDSGSFRWTELDLPERRLVEQAVAFRDAKAGAAHGRRDADGRR